MQSKRLERVSGLLRDYKRNQKRRQFKDCAEVLKQITALLCMSDQSFNAAAPAENPFSSFFDNGIFGRGI